jgi:hypothetical protein
MSRAPRHYLPLADQVKAVDWLKENWETRVLPEKLSSQEIVDAIASEKGVPKITKGNLQTIMGNVFPQWTLPLPRLGSRFSATDFDELCRRVSDMDEKLAAALDRIAHLEKEFGVKPMTAFLPPQLGGSRK